MYGITWKPKAARQLEKLRDYQARVDIIDAVDGLANFPSTHNVKSLKNHDYGYRLRVGRYRVLFDVDKEVHVIDIQEVKKRDEHTY